MPQLDIVTYSGQVFWLFVVFFVYYTIVLRHVLPMLARILKARQKKLEISRSNVDGFGTENIETGENFDNLVISSLQGSSSSSRDHLVQSNSWIQANDAEAQLTVLHSSNTLILNNIASDKLELEQLRKFA